MAGACNNEDFRKKVGISRDVACEFFHADQAKKGKSGEKKKGPVKNPGHKYR